jgi:hypothetical protein
MPHVAHRFVELQTKGAQHCELCEHAAVSPAQQSGPVHGTHLTDALHIHPGQHAVDEHSSLFSAQPSLVASQRPLRQTSPAQQEYCDPQIPFTSWHVALEPTQTPASQTREQQSPGSTHARPSNRQPRTHVSPTHWLPPQHARSARQCSPVGAHSHAPSRHANEQQSWCAAHDAPARPHVGPGCHDGLPHETTSRTARASARLVIAADTPPRARARRRAPALPSSSARRAGRAC